MRAWGLSAIAGALLVGFTPSAPEVISPRIERASVFSNGLVMLVREAPIPVGEHTYKLDKIPRAFADTFWVTTTEGVTISDLSTKLILDEKTEELEAKTLVDYLTANVGGRISMRVHNDKGGVTEVVGKLVDMSLQHNQISLMDDAGRLRMISINSISDLDTQGLKSTLSGSRSAGTLELSFRSSATRPGKVRIVTVERGAAFQNSYWIDSRGEQVTLRARSQLISGTLELDQAQVKLIVGSPQGLRSGVYDAATGAASMDEILAGSQGFAAFLLETNPDPYQVFQANMASGTVNRQYGYAPPNRVSGLSGGFSGGMGSGFGGGGEAGSPPPANRPGSISQPPTVTRTLENLYEQPFGRATLKPGERITRETANVNTTAQAVHRVQFSLERVAASPVHRILKVKNITDMPWPEGSVFISRENVPLFKGAMPFTAPGRTADITLGEVDDITAKLMQSEAGRQHAASSDPNWLEVTITSETQVELRNDRGEEVEIEVELTKGVGTVISDGGAEITYVPTAVGQRNQAFGAKWVLKLAPFSERTVKITYRMVELQRIAR